MFERIVNSPSQLVTIASSCYATVVFDDLWCFRSLQTALITELSSDLELTQNNDVIFLGLRKPLPILLLKTVHFNVWSW